MAGFKHLLVAGTCFEYGLQNGCLHEELTPNPVTPYGLAKDSLADTWRPYSRFTRFDCNGRVCFSCTEKVSIYNSLLPPIGPGNR